MKEATGEVNMTVITIVAIGLIAAFFAIFWDDIEARIRSSFNSTGSEIESIRNDG